MEEVELKRCPFCKSDKNLALDIIRLKKREVVAIECKCCGVRMHRHIDYRKGDFAEDVFFDLVSNWNNRKKLPKEGKE